MKKIISVFTGVLLLGAAGCAAQTTNAPGIRSAIWNTNQLTVAGWNYTNVVDWSGSAWTNSNTRIFLTNSAGLFSFYRTNLSDTNSAVIGDYTGVSGASNVVVTFDTISLSGNNTNIPGYRSGASTWSTNAPIIPYTVFINTNIIIITLAETNGVSGTYYFSGATNELDGWAAYYTNAANSFQLIFDPTLVGGGNYWVIELVNSDDFISYDSYNSSGFYGITNGAIWEEPNNSDASSALVAKFLNTTNFY